MGAAADGRGTVRHAAPTAPGADATGAERGRHRAGELRREGGGPVRGGGEGRSGARRGPLRQRDGAEAALHGAVPRGRAPDERTPPVLLRRGGRLAHLVVRTRAGRTAAPGVPAGRGGGPRWHRPPLRRLRHGGGLGN